MLLRPKGEVREGKQISQSPDLSGSFEMTLDEFYIGSRGEFKRGVDCLFNNTSSFVFKKTPIVLIGVKDRIL